MHRDYAGKVSSSVFKAVVCQVRKTDGSNFAPATLICIRAAIQIFLTLPSVNRQISIIDSQEFKLAKATLKASVARFLRRNHRRDISTEAINKEDLNSLSSYFNRASAEKVQHEVFYSPIHHFGYRGRE